MREKNRKEILANLLADLPELETVYKDIHAHPELSMQETRTAGIASNHLSALGFETTTGVGKTGVVGILRNGNGPTVMLRADMDALPIKETTGLEYASTVTATDDEGRTVPVAHSCGHDMHVACLIGATRLLARSRSAWKGTLMAVFQPGEETAQGAEAMLGDGMLSRFPKPDVVLGQHVMCLPSGKINWREGVVTSAADSLQIRMFGRGAHGSMPESSIDPVVMAASTVMRLQSIVSREISPTDCAVVTVGSLQAGMKENVIPDDAVLKLNVRTFDEEVRKRVLAAIERIANAEAEASGALMRPEITPLHRYTSVRNDTQATRKVVKAFLEGFPADSVEETKPTMASEDFGCFGARWNVPAVYWFFGGEDPATYAKAKQDGKLGFLPTNHNPAFAPVIHPTLETGVKALVFAALAWLAA
ncbi:MAG: M20 family metallopeptidase [Syntrophobacteraceae bacterium]